MSQSHKLSLGAAILINMNIMLGSGIFVNTVELVKQAGSLGPLVYILVGLLIFPLILAIVRLLSLSPGGGTFYHFGLLVHPYVGFLSSWSYFVAKLCSCALGIHVCISFLQRIIPLLQVIPTVALDMLVVALFTLLNLRNLRFGQSMQYAFMGLKLIPITFVIIAGLYLYSGAYFTGDTLLWSGVPASIPLVLYAFSGFEASCSLSSALEKPERNGPRAIMISYALVISIVVLYQLLFFGSLGSYLGSLAHGYLDMFPALLHALPISSDVLRQHIITLMHIGIASSSLGASYGIMYSNSWNLYTLARHDHVIGSSLFATLNTQLVPYACILLEGALVCMYIVLTGGYQIPLQQVSALGGTIAYTCSALALLYYTYYKLSRSSAIIPLLSMSSCFILIMACIWSVYSRGVSPLLYLFVALILLGSVMFFSKKR